MKFTVKDVRGHYEVFDAAGRFLFSSDSESEIDEYFEENTSYAEL